VAKADIDFETDPNLPDEADKEWSLVFGGKYWMPEEHAR